jgi:hypothetical protein
MVAMQRQTAPIVCRSSVFTHFHMQQTNGRLDAHFGFHSGQIESQW